MCFTRYAVSLGEVVRHLKLANPGPFHVKGKTIPLKQSNFSAEDNEQVQIVSGVMAEVV
jgi:hypothetical protein